MTKRKPPPIWAVVCTDVDGKRYVMGTAHARHGARLEAYHWRAREHDAVILHGRTKYRRYSVVRYLPSPGKKRGRKCT